MILNRVTVSIAVHSNDKSS